MPKEREWAKEKGNNRTRKRQKANQRLHETQFLVRHSQKNVRGNWYVKGPVSIDIDTAEHKTLQNLEIPPKFFTIGGVGLYEAIEKKCGGTQRPY